MFKNFKVLYFLIFVSITSVSCAQEIPCTNWTYIDYKYNSGPLPPKYYFEYICRINNDGSALLMYKKGYSDTIQQKTCDFQVSKDTIAILNKFITDSKILSEEIQSMPENEHPIGGHIRYVSVIIVDTNSNIDRPPRVISSPAFPVEKYKTGLDDLYDFMASLIPAEVWNKVKSD
jgi:hypothetical protein